MTADIPGLLFVPAWRSFRQTTFSFFKQRDRIRTMHLQAFGRPVDGDVLLNPDLAGNPVMRASVNVLSLKYSRGGYRAPVQIRSWQSRAYGRRSAVILKPRFYRICASGRSVSRNGVLELNGRYSGQQSTNSNIVYIIHTVFKLKE